MSVYVDDAKNKYGYFRMSHMVADSTRELLEMADKIGVQRKWIQDLGYPAHFDICQEKRIAAVRNGAIRLTQRELVLLCQCLRAKERQE